MAYQRKTADEWEVQAYYDVHGWEVECTETTFRQAKRTKKEYEVNAPGVSYRIVKRRVRKAE